MRGVVMALCLFLSVFQLSAATESKSSKILFGDVYVTSAKSRLVFGNNKIELQFDKATGNWDGFINKQDGYNLFKQSNELSFDLKVDEKPVLKTSGSHFVSYSVVTDSLKQTVTLQIVSTVSDTKQVKVYAYYSLFADKGKVQRHFSIESDAPINGASHLEGVLFNLPGLVIGNAADCTLNFPGPFFPNSFVTPNSPYQSLINKKITFHSSPDGGFGLMMLTNNKLKQTLACWISTGGRTNYLSSISSNKRWISFLQQDLKYFILKGRVKLLTDTQNIALYNGGPQLVFNDYRQMLKKTMPVDTNTPHWVRGMKILELYPQYFKDGFKGITQRLAFYKNIGFNTIYLMPHWMGGYMPLDPFEVNPELGSENDLKHLVVSAHDLGMKVLFDMVIHGYSKESKYVKQHPEYFIHEADGKLALHPVWKSVSTDWSSQPYRKFMDSLVTHDINTYDIDGYRVDAASFKGPDWDSSSKLPAYQNGDSSPGLLTGMLKTMNSIKPGSVLLSEVFGPVFYTVCNLVHDNQCEADAIILEKMKAGSYTAEMYKQHLEEVFGLLPEGVNRVFYTRNHDTSWFYKFDGYTPDFFVMEVLNSFFGIPEVFGGDPKSKFNPDDNPEIYNRYKTIFNYRDNHPELMHGKIILNAITSGNPSVFCGGRQLAQAKTWVLASFSGRDQNTNISLKGNRNWRITSARDLFTGKVTRLSPDAHGNLSIKLKPYQVLVCSTGNAKL